MAVCLCHVEGIVRDQYFFTDFISIHSEGRYYSENLDAPVHGENDGASYNSM